MPGWSESIGKIIPALIGGGVIYLGVAWAVGWPPFNPLTEGVVQNDLWLANKDRRYPVFKSNGAVYTCEVWISGSVGANKEDDPSLQVIFEIDGKEQKTQVHQANRTRIQSKSIGFDHADYPPSYKIQIHVHWNCKELVRAQIVN